MTRAALILATLLCGCVDHQHVQYATKSEVSYLKARVGDLEDRVGATTIAIKPPSLSEQIALIAAAVNVKPPEKPPEGFWERIPTSVWVGLGTLIATVGGATYIHKRKKKEEPEEPEA